VYFGKFSGVVKFCFLYDRNDDTLIVEALLGSVSAFAKPPSLCDSVGYNQRIMNLTFYFSFFFKGLKRLLPIHLGSYSLHTLLLKLSQIPAK